jgi:hypothetical protein
MGENREVLRTKVNEMTSHLGCAFVDSAFLAIWAVINFGASRLIDRFHLTGVDLIEVRCLQVLFALWTLSPICIWVYRDIRVMFIRAKMEIASVAQASGSRIQ